MANTKIAYNLQPKVTSEKIFDHRATQVKEAATIYGRPAFFLSQSKSIVDDILSEVQSKSFQMKNTIPLFYMNDDDMEDMDGSMVYGGFNMIPLYSKIIHIPVLFLEERGITPISGDLIYIPDNNQEEMLFEITKDPIKEQDRKNVKNGRRFAYKLFMKLYSNDRGNVDFDGDLDDILDEDDIATMEDLKSLDELADSLDGISIEDKVEKQQPIPSTIKKRIDKNKTYIHKNKTTKKGRFENL